MRIDKERALRERSQWARALREIAEEGGKGSTIYKMLGTTAWGRFDGEPVPDETKDNVVFGLGFLQGVRYAALLATEVHQVKGENALRYIHQRILEYNRK